LRTSSKLTDTHIDREVQEISLPRPADADYPNYAGAGPFNVDFPVTRLYRAYGWLCDKDNQRLDARNHPVVKGDIARVCVIPDDIAIFQDNVRIRTIDSFTWYREDIVNVTQPAITSNAVAEDRTEIFCTQGSLVCALETSLVDEFFKYPGAIQGRGIVWLQFGKDGGRMLQTPLEINTRPSSNSNNRQLQYSLEDYAFGAQYLPIADPGFAGASPYDAVIYVLPPVDERELFRCRAYECDYNNVEFVTDEPKKEGQSVRMCVRPSQAAEDVGAKMWSIEWWKWSQVDRIQDAIIEQGEEAPDGRTVNFCVRGMDACYFQTNLIPIFFSTPQPNAINGEGVCWITFGDMYAIPGPIEIEKPEEPVKIDPTKDPLYAGHNPIEIIFRTEGDYVEILEECPPEDHTVTGWWNDLDDSYRMMIIAGIVLTSLCCCIPWVCLFCNRRRQSDVEEEVEIKKGDGNVLVNVDVGHKNKTCVDEENYVEELSGKLEYDERTNTSSKGMKKKFDGRRGTDDIDFDDSGHSGTLILREEVRRYIKTNPDMDYGPKPLQYFRELFDDRYFLLKKKNDGKWREAEKSEIVAGIGEIWKKEKKRLSPRKKEYRKSVLGETTLIKDYPTDVSEDDSEVRLNSREAENQVPRRSSIKREVLQDDKRSKSTRRSSSGGTKYRDDDEDSRAVRRSSRRKSPHDDDTSRKPARQSSRTKILDEDIKLTRPRSRSKSLQDDETSKPLRRGSSSRTSLQDEEYSRPLQRQSSTKSLKDGDSNHDLTRRSSATKSLKEDQTACRRSSSSRSLKDNNETDDQAKRRRSSSKCLGDDQGHQKTKRRSSTNGVEDDKR